jgi:hypothetical protein
MCGISKFIPCVESVSTDILPAVISSSSLPPLLLLGQGALSFLGPLMWGWLAVDLALKSIGTDYARIIRAVFILAQVGGAAGQKVVLHRSHHSVPSGLHHDREQQHLIVLDVLLLQCSLSCLVRLRMARCAWCVQEASPHLSLPWPQLAWAVASAALPRPAVEA